MHKDRISALQVDLCPFLRYVRCDVERLLTEYSKTSPRTDQSDEVTGRALDLARLLTNVVIPLSGNTQPANITAEMRHQAERLYDLARPWVHHHPSDFPEPREKSLLILDRLEQLEQRIENLFKVRQGQRRAA